jgi:hypothetical protein
MKNKRGSHVGMIVSFIIFITFLVFLYSISEPSVKSKSSKEYIVGYIKTSMEDYFATELNTWVISVPDGGSLGSCVQIPDMTSSGKKVVVKDELNNIVGFQISSGVLSFEFGGGMKKLFRIYSADEKFIDYSESLSGCSNSASYSIAIAKTREVPSYSKIGNFASNFSNEYNLFKTKYKIPEDVDFSFTFKFADGTINETNVDESNKNIYAEEFALKYLDRDTNIQTGMLTVKVW